jgi:hypothetical protein
MGNENSVAVLAKSSENETSAANPGTTAIKPTKPKTRAKKVSRALLLGGVSLLALLSVARFIWVASGSNQWEFFGEKNGIKVYTLKAPGVDLIQAKGVFRVHSSLAGVIKLLRDPNTCKDLGCVESYDIERVDDQLEYSHFRINLPPPFRPRDFVIRSQVYQSPNTGEVIVEIAAAPGKAPLNNCCVRVNTMNNTWRLTPLENGQVEIEYVLNMNEGGFIPDILLNTSHPKTLFNLGIVETLLNKEKLQTAKLDFIKER